MKEGHDDRAGIVALMGTGSPDIVVIDPLRDAGRGDPHQDDVTTDASRGISEVTRHGGVRRTPRVDPHGRQGHRRLCESLNRAGTLPFLILIYRAPVCRRSAAQSGARQSSISCPQEEVVDLMTCRDLTGLFASWTGRSLPKPIGADPFRFIFRTEKIGRFLPVSESQEKPAGVEPTGGLP